jgi:processive 1,2-diacylglycerol beta-glucosyltransferase
MRVLVTYAAAGAGHSKAAQALYRCFKEIHPEIDVKIVDLVDKSTPLFRYSYLKGYTFLVKHSFFLWGLLFSMTERGPLHMLARKISSISPLEIQSRTYRQRWWNSFQ